MAAPRARPDPLVGTVVEGCELLEKLGRGRTGNVYKARYEAVEKLVAVKVLRGELARRPELREAFLREARAIAALDHESIVKIYDVLESVDSVLIVMELLEGRNLWEMLQDGEKFSPERAARIVTQVAGALDAAHRQKLVHRDVKPQNVIVLGKDRIRVVDFGLAALPGSGGDRVGTPHYMAPEQATRSKVDGAADVYALGATLYHLLTGQTPYQGDTVGEILKAHQEGQLVPPKQVDAMIPAELDSLVRQMMAPAKGYRPAAAQVVKTLEDFRAEAEARRRRARGARRAAPGGRRPAPPRRGSALGPILAGLLAVSALLGVILILVVVTQPDEGSGDEEPQPEVPRVAGPGPTPPTPEPREADPRIRQELADRALEDALAWHRANPDRMDGALERLRAVARDHPNSAAARRALKEAGDLELRRPAPRVPEPPPREEPPSRPRISLTELERQYGEARRLAGRLQVDEAEKMLASLLDDAEGTRIHESVRRETEALAFVRFFRDELIRMVEASSGTVSYRRLKPAHPNEDAMILGADVEGLKIGGGDGKSWTEKWEDLSAPEIIDLAKSLLPKSPRLSFAFGVYLVRAGQKEKAEEQFMYARMLQRTSGEFEDLIERLGR